MIEDKYTRTSSNWPSKKNAAAIHCRPLIVSHSLAELPTSWKFSCAIFMFSSWKIEMKNSFFIHFITKSKTGLFVLKHHRTKQLLTWKHFANLWFQPGVKEMDYHVSTTEYLNFHHRLEDVYLRLYIILFDNIPK